MLRINLFKLVVLIGMSFLGNAVLAQKFTLFTDLKTPSTPGQKLNKEELPTRQVKLNEEVLQAIAQEAPSKLLLSVPLFTGQETILELARKEVVTADFKVTESGKAGKATAYKPGVYYQGHLRGLPKSIVAISFFEEEVMGTILLENTVFSFGKHDPKENFPANVYKLINEKTLLAEVGTGSLPSLCGTSDDISAELSETMSRLSASAINPQSPTTAALLSDVIKIYFECDQKMYLDRGSSTTATVNYVTSLFNIVQTLYTNEQINTQISEVFVWTTADGYPTNSSFSALAAFGNRRGPNPINGNIAQLLSTNTNNLGGVAWLDVLCDVPTFIPSQGTYVGPISYSNISNSFAAFPTYSWTTMVVTHELGHNIGSPHTQSCSWPGGALDNCYQTEGGCPAGPAPINGGTIMSYCHLTSSGINFNNGFGTLPGNLIRDRVSNATCLTAGGGTCALSVSPTTISYTTAGGSQIITITSASAWTASDDASWLTLTSTSGGGNATITATALANTGVARTATITVTCGATTRTISISQAGVPSCTLSTNPTAINFSTSFGNRQLTINSSSSWTASDDAAWLSLSRTSGSSSTNVTVSAQTNTGAARTATITITCGVTTVTVVVSQAGTGGSCTLSVSPTSLTYTATGGGQNVSITSSAAWTASDNAAWLTLNSTSGTGNATVVATAQANTGTARTATITVTCGGTTRTISVSQDAASAGCTLTVSPTSLSYTATGGDQNVSITSSAAWTASDDANWLSLNSTSGSGNATVVATAQTNTGAARTATITVTCGSTTRTISVSQAAASGGGCTLSVNPTTLTYTSSGGSQNVGITSSAAWTASDNAPWLTLSSTAGSGNATISATAQANSSSSARSATITVTCGSSTTTISVSQPGRPGRNGLIANAEEFDLAVAPNPVKTMLNINWQQPEDADVILQLFDMNGRLIWQKRYTQLENGTYNENVEVSTYAPGTYILRLNTPKQPIMKRIIIE